MSEGRRRSARFGEEGEAGEERLGCGWAGEEVFLGSGDRKRGRGYHVSCKEGEAGLLCHQPSRTSGPEPEELRRDPTQVIDTGDCTSENCLTIKNNLLNFYEVTTIS